ncbi:MAG: MBL fold metallo-hydrolase [Bacteroidota bacterium]
MSVSRRAALKGLGAFGLAAALPTAARASTPEASGADHHTVSAHSFAVGDATVTVIRDTGFQIPPSAIGTNAADGAVETLLDSYGLPTDVVPTDVCVTLIETGGERTLLDAGTGNGELMGTLSAIGIEPGSIDRVVISHFHGDHIGGIAPGGTPAFPNATVHMSAPEAAFLDGAGDDNRGANAAKTAIDAVGFVQLYEDGAELASGLTAVAAPGHTPGHMAFLLQSGDARLMVGSDTANHPVAFFRHPEWGFGFDMDVPQTVATRYRVLGRAADERIPFLSTHMPFPGVGRVSRDGAGFRFTPTPYAP